MRGANARAIHDIVGPMELIAAVVIAGFLLAAVFLLVGRLAALMRARGSAARTVPKSAAKAGGRSAPPRSGTTPRECPLCSSVLGPGERVASKLFPGKGDRIMHIMGCVHCWPARPSVPRICPVCGGALDAEGWVTARYFERPGMPGRGPGRRHVHVLGCSHCRHG
jgi:hypothetical protein